MIGADRPRPPAPGPPGRRCVEPGSATRRGRSGAPRAKRL